MFFPCHCTTRQYNERYHLAIASFLMLEVMLLGIPILFASGKKDPSALMVVGSWMFAISAFAVLLPMFFPKVGVEEGWMEDKYPMYGPEFTESLARSMQFVRRIRGGAASSSQNESSGETSRKFGISNMFRLRSGEIRQPSSE